MLHKLSAFMTCDWKIKAQRMQRVSPIFGGLSACLPACLSGLKHHLNTLTLVPNMHREKKIHPSVSCVSSFVGAIHPRLTSRIDSSHLANDSIYHLYSANSTIRLAPLSPASSTVESRCSMKFLPMKTRSNSTPCLPSQGASDLIHS
jgi:hypothetical protein